MVVPTAHSTPWRNRKKILIKKEKSPFGGNTSEGDCLFVVIAYFATKKTFCKIIYYICRMNG